MAIIRTKGLTYTYPVATKPAVDGVSITIEKGEFAVLTGPSGCGKTTLCRCFNGLIPHFYRGDLRGQLQVTGLDVKETPIHELALHVGLVFQNPENQLFALSVEKDVAFGLENLGMPRNEMQKQVDYALETSGISHLRLKAPHELSGGQQQRVAIAGIIAMQPEVMVLDEPTSFLDPLGAEKIFKVVRALNQEHHMTVILVEHRLDLAARYADHVIVMDRGKVILDGEPKDVLSSEKARLIGVGIPKVTLLYQQLAEVGLLKTNEVPLSSEEITALLRGVLND
ncbi:MAG: ATP-binding cassette domain-containing protein [Candidatus Bathyarchaeota archaeon]|nr:MAG: ATP-binding cassette domain-containing protein [Candidatus Bathyarchaeota archaeon]